MTELLVLRKASWSCVVRAAAPWRLRRAAFPARWSSMPSRFPQRSLFSQRHPRPVRPAPVLADDPAGQWKQAEGPAFPFGAGAAVERIWVVEPGVADGELWCGVAPAALFHSRDGGKSWSLVQSCGTCPSGPSGTPAPAGFASGSDLPVAWRPAPPGNRDISRWRLAHRGRRQELATLGSASWCRAICRRKPAGHAHALRPQHETRAARTRHALPAIPRRRVSLIDCRRELDRHRRSEGRLPSDFGFPLAIDPHDPNRAFVIPLVADADRVTPEGKVRVYGRRERGASWQALEKGLPQSAGLPHSAAPGLLQRCRQTARPLFRGTVGRSVRIGGRRPDLVDAGGPPARRSTCVARA